ncbi:MAG: uL30 family ribosomal protein [Flavobacteriales bacterium]
MLSTTIKYKNRLFVCLGLKKINQEVRHKVSPQILGVISMVAHLLKIEEI